jgi:hypothetical protein
MHDNDDNERLVSIEQAKVGDMVDPATLPVDIVKEGGGWVGLKYVVDGCHKSGQRGFRCAEVRGFRPTWQF